MLKHTLTTLFLSALLLFINLLIPKDSFALAKFSTSYQVNYNVYPNGSTHVKYFINQKNNLSVVYATDFSLSVNHTKISNVRVVDENTSIASDVTKLKNQTIITFTFLNKVVGKDKNHFFSIEYDTEDVTTKFGSTWQINIPRLEADENLTEQNIILTIPPTFPKPAYVDPKPSVIVNNVYYFTGNLLANKSISAVFGQTQYFKTNLKYHLLNDSNFKAQQSIAIPPDTSYQQIYIESIDPKPEKFYEDQDGNLMALYNLDAHSKKDITLNQYIKLNFTPKPEPRAQTENYLASSEIWDFENNIFTIPEVKNLSTAKSIYDYVADKFVYDYQKINKIKSQKIPASESLKDSSSAICTDFANVFVALARKVGIPSRELEGYAFSENPDLKPLSLTQDVLHAWPEYFNRETKTWTQIDPTWANTTHGVDYFNKLDLNHIVFVIHGSNATTPISAGGYKNGGENTRDVEISPIDPIDFPIPKIQIESVKQKNNLLVISISNDSGVGYQGDITISGSEFFPNSTQPIKVAPFVKTEVSIAIDKLPLMIPKNIQTIIYLNNNQYENRVTIQPQISSFGILTGSVILLGAIAFSARYLHLRRRR